MSVTKESLEKRIADIDAEITNGTAQLNALSGAKQAYALILKELTAPAAPSEPTAGA